jgi:hypothetical protein
MGILFQASGARVGVGSGGVVGVGSMVTVGGGIVGDNSTGVTIVGVGSDVVGVAVSVA